MSVAGCIGLSDCPSGVTSTDDYVLSYDPYTPFCCADPGAADCSGPLEADTDSCVREWVHVVGLESVRAHELVRESGLLLNDVVG